MDTDALPVLLTVAYFVGFFLGGVVGFVIARKMYTGRHWRRR